LRVQLAHGGDCAVVQVLAEDEGPRDAHQRLAGVAAAERPRLDPGVALPLAAVRHEVLLERIEAHRQWPVVAPWAQPHVDAEGAPVGRRLVERADELAPEALEEFVMAEPARALRLAVARVGEDQVDVGGNVELAPAELAHADDDKALPRAV